ncbi:MAG: molybdopterin molybdotransferase MoeA [Magnetococcales bacterium]|nr:molybdopterin molybdotransferase MoeA [Magnetococcales bacterium]
MISFDEARTRVLEHTPVMDTIEVRAVTDALGWILATPITAPFNVPNADNSAMDGYGVRHEDLDPHHPVPLKIVANLPAGDRLNTPLQPGEAVRIMTGAPVPLGCNCVVPREDVDSSPGQVVVPPGQKRNANIRFAGEDMVQGTRVLTQGRRLGPVDLGLLTSLGLVEVPVFRKPVVALLSTGNEVMAAGTPLKPGWVYDSNRTSLRAALSSLGVEVLDLGLVPDQREAITDALTRGGQQADAIISTGGVSAGDFDLVKPVLRELGEIVFWKVAMQPGKPQAYGKLGRAMFFGLPGNPVACLVVYHLIVRQALLKMMGAAPMPLPIMTLPFRGQVKKKTGRMNFLRGRVHFGAPEPFVETTGPQGSALLTSMAMANALIMIPEEVSLLQDGDQVTVLLLDHC